MMKNALATPHWAATKAGRRILSGGGGAVDAAIAAAVTLSVAYPQDCSIGGDLVALVRSPQGNLTVVNASGPAPSGLERSVAEAGVDRMPDTGPLTVTVPGALAGLAELHALGGRTEWAELISHGARLARRGVPVSRTTARFLNQDWTALKQDPGFSVRFTERGEKPLCANALLRQPELADTLERVAQEGVDAFYRGTLGVMFAEGLSRLGSPMRPSDLVRYRAITEKPRSLEWGEYRVHTSGANTQGDVLLLMLAAIAEGNLDPDPLGRDASALTGIAARASRRRDALLGDGCTIQGSALDWQDMNSVRALIEEGTDLYPSTRDKRVGGDTVAIAATDRDGWSVSIIQSVYEPFGARILEPETGIVCHNRGTSFSLVPHHPNRLVDGKRPMHTLMPVIVEKADGVYSVQGTMGGKAQPQIHMQLLGSLISGCPPARAVENPRWVVGGREAASASVVQVEESALPVFDTFRTSEFVIEAISDLHDAVGHVQAIVYAEKGCSAVSDPRSDGSAFVE